MLYSCTDDSPKHALYTARALHYLRSEAQKTSSVYYLLTPIHDKCLHLPAEFQPGRATSSMLTLTAEIQQVM